VLFGKSHCHDGKFTYTAKNVVCVYALNFSEELIDKYCDIKWSRVSSASIVSSYGLDDRAIQVRYPAEAKDFSLTSESRTAVGLTQCPVHWVPGVLSPGAKRGRGVTLTTHPHVVPSS
jgi:hypothetical protein